MIYIYNAMAIFTILPVVLYTRVLNRLQLVVVVVVVFVLFFAVVSLPSLFCSLSILY